MFRKISRAKVLTTKAAVVRVHTSKMQCQHSNLVIHILYTMIGTVIHIYPVRYLIHVQALSVLVRPLSPF